MVLIYGCLGGHAQAQSQKRYQAAQEAKRNTWNNEMLIYGSGILALLGYLGIQWYNGGSIRNPKIARAYWATRREEVAAKKRALKQIKNPKRNAVSLYIGANIHSIYENCMKLYKGVYFKHLGTENSENYKEKALLLQEILKILKDVQKPQYRKKIENQRLYIPDVQRGIAVCGAPGSGKTFSVIDPSLRSAVDQGHPILLYDFKYPDQASLLVPYALLNGYKVRIFAPGFDESDVCNPINFLKHVLDAETARQISVVLNKNFNLGDTKGDKFFDSAADQLMEAAFMLSRSFREADILSVQAFLSLANLVPRLKIWAERQPEQDLAILLLVSKTIDFLDRCRMSKELLMPKFNFSFMLGNDEIAQINLIEELISFLCEYFYDPNKQVDKEQIIDNLKRTNNNKIIQDIDETNKQIKFLENQLPESLYLEGYGKVERSFSVRIALEKMIQTWQDVYNNPKEFVEELRKNEQKSKVLEQITNEKFTTHVSFIIDALVYFLNIHPDYNPASGQLRTKNVKSWVRSAFSQLISTEKSERTLASIISVTNNNLIRFVKPNIARHFVGETTLPLYLEKKELIVFGLDRERRDTVGPLMATILHLIVNYNLTYRKNGERRKYPLIVALDELPTMYLPALTNWLNENRSDGFCGQIGFQNMNQLERAYGREVARSILTGCNTKFIFNPGEPESAEFFARMLGDEELIIKQRSRSSGKGGGSTSISEQERQRKLLEPPQFLKLPPGKCVFMNPGYENQKETSIPLVRQIHIPEEEIKIIELLKPFWDEFCHQRIKSLGGNKAQDERLHLNRRQTFVECLFAIKQEEEEESE